MEVRWEGRMEVRWEGRMEVRWEGRKADHLEGLMEALKVQAVEAEGLLLFEGLVLLEQAQVVQQVVKEETMEQARTAPELVELVSTNQQQAEQ